MHNSLCNFLYSTTSRCHPIRKNTWPTNPLFIYVIFFFIFPILKIPIHSLKALLFQDHPIVEKNRANALWVKRKLDGQPFGAVFLRAPSSRKKKGGTTALLTRQVKSAFTSYTGLQRGGFLNRTRQGIFAKLWMTVKIPGMKDTWKNARSFSKRGMIDNDIRRISAEVETSNGGKGLRNI